MGTFDFPSLLGNRSAEQMGYNFDYCHKDERNKNECPRKNVKEIKESVGDTGEPNEGEISFENAALIIEVFRIPKTTEFAPLDNFIEYEKHEEELRKFEKGFMKNVYPFRKKNQVRLYKCRADAVEWEFHPCTPCRQYVPLPNKFDYNVGGYCYAGIFKFRNDHKNLLDEDELKPEMMFWAPRFNHEKEEIWMRVWYEQVWSGIIEADDFIPTQLSDECLVWIAHELGFDHPEKKTRKDLWNMCKKEITNRYFKDE